MKIKQKNFDLHSLRCDLGYKLDIAREFINDVYIKVLFYIIGYLFPNEFRFQRSCISNTSSFESSW